ncbi:hybrid sensor histidine kinase/response regulator [Sphingomonas sp. RIT328]|uniref:hybrid sensor histidine kinase/response regulator n=1 Tax=Sphingomonas sp. RIT328 TaxID=1470591 RepID=UPI00044C0C31|nr:ATP-binding protein [Sphingomonas sp. RIT328]EZP55767.1 Two-component hybrid sensor and regulator [Sphingomonas sp. RIT328]
MIEPTASDPAIRAELERAKAANEAKTRYLAAVSHEIRSPLNVIYGYAQLLERDPGISGAEAGTIIRRSAEHVTNLVEGLLEISRIESGVMTIRAEPIDIRALLQQVVAMFRMQAAAKGLALTLEIDARLPDRVKADDKRLRQILINLVSNAIKYTDAGSVAVHVGYRSQVADITVRDTGIGIAAEDLDRVFAPFDRGSSSEAQRQPGIGLGLAITRVLASVLGGDIAVTSTPGAGSAFRFRVMLPAVDRAVRGANPGGAITGYHGARRTVLAIDDDPAQRAILHSLLVPLGFRVETAANGPDGLALAARIAPDIVLLDIQMPGMTGWQVASRLRADHGGALRIVLVSADAHDLGAPREGRDSHDAFMTKPVELDALVTLIGSQLDLRWEQADTPAPAPASADDAMPRDALPPEAGALLEQARAQAGIGHVRGVERALDALATSVPEAAGLVAVLRRHLHALDLRSLVQTIDDAA